MKRFVAFLIVSVLLLMSGCSPKTDENPSNNDNNVETNWQKATNNVALSNSNFEITFDYETAKFTLLDINNSAKYSSRITNSEVKESLSELLVTCYNNQSNSTVMDSFSKSTSRKKFEIFTNNNNSVRVEYTFSSSDIDVIVPKVFTVEVYEEIISKLSSREVLMMENTYTKYKASDNSTKTAAMKEQYPYLNKHDMYVNVSKLSDAKTLQIAEYMEKAGYTHSDYMADVEMMEINIEHLDIPLSFVLPVEYTLTEKGLDVKVCHDEIELSNPSYTIQNIEVLPYFTLENEPTDEAVLIADGSGSWIDFKDGKEFIYKKNVYGQDVVIDSLRVAGEKGQYNLPMYAYSSNGGSYVAIITNAAEAATVNVASKSAIYERNKINTSFATMPMDTLTIRPGSNMSPVNYYAANEIIDQPTVSYYFMKPDANSNDFADVFRDWFIDNNENVSSSSKKSSIFLEFTGFTTIRASFFGVSYNKKIVLSTLSDIQSNIDKLHENGVRGINVRLKDIGNQGTFHGPANTFSIYKGVGTIEELKTLAETLNNHGGCLYIENDPTVSFKDNMNDGFSYRKDTLKQIDATIGFLSDYDIVQGDYSQRVWLSRYLVSPRKYEEYTESFTNKLFKKIGDIDLGLSWGAAGNLLLSDFSKKSVIHRGQTAEIINNALKKVEGSYSGIMINGGNAYSLEFADTVIGAPLFSSGYTYENETLAFYQSIVHGLIAYTGEAINCSIYSDNLILKSIESGAGLFYSCITEEEGYKKLNGNFGNALVPNDIDLYIDEITDLYSKISGFYESVADSKIVEHKMLQTGVYLTKYENGNTAFVNYNDNEVECFGRKIAAKSFCLVEGEI